MREGQPYILVVGAADTGRTPLLVALVRRELGTAAAVASAGVVAHAGEPADPNATIALEQFGLSLGHHIARHLDAETMREADLLLCVDRGTARVAKMRGTKEVAAISELAGTEDVPDPHRMPLGVWVAAARAFEAQLATAIPAIRQLAGIGGSSSVQPAPPADGPDPTAQAAPAPTPSGDNRREEHLQRIHRLLDTARVLPEIVDWSKLAQETCERLGAVSGMSEGQGDLTPAATAMLAGLILQARTVPTEAELGLLQSAIEALTTPLDAAGLARIGQIVVRMNTA